MLIKEIAFDVQRANSSKIQLRIQVKRNLNDIRGKRPRREPWLSLYLLKFDPSCTGPLQKEPGSYITKFKHDLSDEEEQEIVVEVDANALYQIRITNEFEVELLHEDPWKGASGCPLMVYNFQNGLSIGFR